MSGAGRAPDHRLLCVVDFGLEGGADGTALGRLHLDLVSESPEHRSEMVDRFITLGAEHVDIGQGDVPWVVMADPDGNGLRLSVP